MVYSLISTLLFLLLVPVQALAQAAEHGATEAAHAAGEHAAAHGPALYSLEWWLHTNVVNIVLAAIVIIWAVRKANAHKIFHNQQADIKNELDTLYAERDKANAALAAIQQRTANLNGEVDEILSNATQSAQDLRAKILADAQAEADSIVERSHQRMAQEDKRMMRNLQEQVLADAVASAKEALGQLPDAQKANSVNTFAEQLASK